MDVQMQLQNFEQANGKTIDFADYNNMLFCNCFCNQIASYPEFVI